MRDDDALLDGDGDVRDVHRLLEGLLDVFYQVVRVLDPHAESDEVEADAVLLPVRFGDALMMQG